MNKPVTPLLTVDIIVELGESSHFISDTPIVLIKRKYPPYGYALPGGFVDVGETLAQAAVREAKEEISLDVELIALLGCYSDPTRDRRGHTVSAVYIARAQGKPLAADDAKEVLVVKPGQIPGEMAFDHGIILADYLNYRATGMVAPIER